MRSVELHKTSGKNERRDRIADPLTIYRYKTPCRASRTRVCNSSYWWGSNLNTDNIVNSHLIILNIIAGNNPICKLLPTSVIWTPRSTAQAKQQTKFLKSTITIRGHPQITSHEFHDFFTPPPSLSQVVTFLRPLPSVTSHILQFYT